MEKIELTTIELISILNFENSSNDYIHYVDSSILREVVIKKAIIDLNIISGDFGSLNIRFHDCDFVSESGIELEDIRANLFDFLNCSFRDVVEFNQISASLNFTNCTFDTIFRISQLSTNKYSRIINCIFEHEVYITETLYSRGFLFSENKFRKNVILTGNYDGSVKLEKNEFYEDLFFGGEIDDRKTKYTDLSAFKLINILSGIFSNRIVFNKICHQEKLWITNTDIDISRIEIRESIFKNEFVLAHCKIASMTIFGGKFQTSLKTHFAKINEIYISGGKFKLIEIKEGFLDKLQIIGKDEIDNLELSEDILIISEIKLSQGNPIRLFIQKKHSYDGSFWVRDLNFENSVLHLNSIVQIYDVEICKISFYYFINLGVIVFNNVLFLTKVRAKSKRNFQLFFINSDLGKTSFLNCRSSFSISNEFYFTNSKLFEVYFSNDEILNNPKFIEVNNFGRFQLFENNKKRYEQEEELYNQLSKLNENKSSVISALHFRSRSYNVRWKILFEQFVFQFRPRTTSIPIYNLAYNIIAFLFVPISLLLSGVEALFSSAKRKEFYDFLTLSFNRISNNHGVSWQRALVGIILVVGISYSTYCYLCGLRMGSWSSPTERQYFIEVVSYVGDFLTPLNKDDTYLKFYGCDSTVNFPKARLFAIFSQIIVAYFIYQLIQAFRRMGRS